MLNPGFDNLTDRDGNIDPGALAGTLKLSLAELARLVGVSRNALAARPLGPKAREALDPLVRILASAAEMMGSEAKAAFWFRYNPLIGMGMRTPLEHVQDGHAEHVLLYLRNVANGGFA